jgi:hypothetical protein
MLRLFTTLHTLGFTFIDHARTRVDDRERGSETIEKVLWAVAVIAIVGIVVAAISAFVTSKSAQIT